MLAFADTMTFSYLRGLAHLDLLRNIGRTTDNIVTTKAVLGQLHRSGALGPLVKSWCDRHEIHLANSAVGDEIFRMVATTLSKNDSRLVRRNRVDVELVEFARHVDGAIITSEHGLAQLADRRGVLHLDLADVLYAGLRLGLIRERDVDEIVSETWRGESAAGTGAPPILPVPFARLSRDEEKRG